MLTFFAHYASESMLHVYLRIYHKKIPLSYNTAVYNECTATNSNMCEQRRAIKFALQDFIAVP